jgi:multidrug resistance efflux pump
MCAGMVVDPGQPLVEVIDPEHFKFTVPFLAELAAGVQAGQKVDVRFDALSRTTFEAHVAEIITLSEPHGAADQLIVVHFNHQDPRLKPGMTATLEF